MDWINFLNQVAVQIAADVVIIVTLALTLWAATHFRHTRSLRRFFGLSRTTTLRVLVSNMYVRPAGTVGLNSIRKGFTGYAISEAEFVAASRLIAIVQSNPLHRLVRSFGDLILGSTPEPAVQARVTGSPGYIQLDGAGQPIASAPDLSVERLLDNLGTVVAVGSPLYNSTTDHLLRHAGEGTLCKFVRLPDPGPDNIGYTIRVLRYGNMAVVKDFTRRLVHDPDSPHNGLFVEYGLLQRLQPVPGRRSAAFICAGTSTIATTTMIDILGNWRELEREFGTEDFCCIYELVVADREEPTPRAQIAHPPARVWQSPQPLRHDRFAAIE